MMTVRERHRHECFSLKTWFLTKPGSMSSPKGRTRKPQAAHRFDRPVSFENRNSDTIVAEGKALKAQKRSSSLCWPMIGLPVVTRCAIGRKCSPRIWVNFPTAYHWSTRCGKPYNILHYKFNKCNHTFVTSALILWFISASSVMIFLWIFTLMKSNVKNMTMQLLQVQIKNPSWQCRKVWPIPSTLAWRLVGYGS